MNGRRAADVYMDTLHVNASDIQKQTFKNPLGRVVGDEVFIVSVKECAANGQLACYRKVNPKDRLYILRAEDDQKVLEDTIHSIKSEFSHISAVFSVNCIFRYLYFTELGHMNHYLQRMESLGTHAGLIGMGEHYNKQHTNQTMSCVVFE